MQLARPPGSCGQLCQGVQLLLRPFKRGSVILASLIFVVLSTAGIGTTIRLRYDDVADLDRGVLAIIVALGLLIIVGQYGNDSRIDRWNPSHVFFPVFCLFVVLCSRQPRWLFVATTKGLCRQAFTCPEFRFFPSSASCATWLFCSRWMP